MNFKTPDWAKGAVFYQIFPDRFFNADSTNDPPDTKKWGEQPTTRNFFGGDLKGIILKLNYLKELGINAIYLNPIFEANSNHKYNCSDYKKIDKHLGDKKIFKQLIDLFHRNNIRIIIDGVFNHTGINFFAFKDILMHKQKSKYLNWYYVKKFPLNYGTHKPNYECWWGWEELPKLNVENPEVKKYLFNVIKLWTKFKIDGWRLDVPNEINHNFWKKFRKIVKTINPDSYIVGEIWDDGSDWLKGDEFDSVMNYRLRKIIIDFFVKKNINASKFQNLHNELLTKNFEIDSAMFNLLGSHDTERFLTLCNGDINKMKLATFFQFTFIGAPVIYYGDEVGLTGKADPDNRRCMIWKEEKQNLELLNHYKRLIYLRKKFPALKYGKYIPVAAYKNCLAFLRTNYKKSVLIILNNSNKSEIVKIKKNLLNNYMKSHNWIDLYSSKTIHIKKDKTNYKIPINPMEGILLW